MFMKNLSEEFLKTHCKIPIPESLFDEILEIQPAPLLKKDPPTHVFPYKLYEIFKNSFSIDSLRATFSKSSGYPMSTYYDKDIAST